MKFELSRYVTTIRYLAVVPLIVFGLLSILATSGGGGTVGTATGPTVADLAGTWSGTIEGSGRFFSFSMTIDGSGNITQQLVDGFDFGITGTIQKTSGTVFNYVLSDGTVGGFIVDASATHAGFVNEFFESGVVEKNAPPLPTYFSADVTGDWSGVGVDFDSAFNVVRAATSNATVASDLSYTATDTLGGASSGSFTTNIDTPTFGVYEGTFTGSSAAGVVRAFLSADKTFAVTWACDTTDGSDVSVGFPDDCSFFAYTRQSGPLPISIGSIAINPPSTSISTVGGGGNCTGSQTREIFYQISTFDALGQPLDNAVIDITLDHAANTTPGGPVFTQLIDPVNGLVSDVGDPVPYSTTTDTSGKKTISVIYNRSSGCAYSGNMTVSGAGLLTTEMPFTVQ